MIVRFRIAGIQLEDLRVNVDGLIPDGRLLWNPFLIEVAEIEVSLLRGGRKFDRLAKTGFSPSEIVVLRLDDAVKVVQIGISWRRFQRFR